MAVRLTEELASILSLHDWFAIADRIQRDVDEVGLGLSRSEPDEGAINERSLLDRFDEAVSIQKLRAVSRRLFADGHYARAVEEAFKYLNNSVKERSGLTERDGADLMRAAFSANSPVLKMNRFTSESERSEQRGYMEVYAGTMTGIRNPRAHDHELDDQPEVALEMLVLANHLVRKLDDSTLSQASD